jgi:hypothetical protein
LPDFFTTWRQEKGTWILDWFPGKAFANLQVHLFAKGPVTKSAQGDPQKIWHVLSEEAPSPLLAPQQVHGAAVVEALPLWSLPHRPRADGIFLNRPGIWGSLRFADCLPVVIVGGVPSLWCLLLHSGYEGTVRNMAGRALRRLVRRYGTKILENAVVLLAPSIGRCCYCRNENDPATRRGMELFPAEGWEKRGAKIFFDLRRIVAFQLVAEGICEANIHDVDYCTKCSPERLYSYRGGDLHARSFLLAGISKGVHKRRYWWENSNSGELPVQ